MHALRFPFFFGVCGLAALLGGMAPAGAAEVAKPPIAVQPPERAALCASKASLVYLPIYSSIRYLSGEKALLAITVSVRNISPDQPITLSIADFFNADGRKVESLLTDGEKVIPPLGVAELYVRSVDFPDHTAASVVLGWRGDEGATPPIAEAVMVASRGSQSLSFTRSSVEMPDCIK